MPDLRAHGMTAKEVARLTGFDRRTVTKYSAGKIPDAPTPTDGDTPTEGA